MDPFTQFVVMVLINLVSSALGAAGKPKVKGPEAGKIEVPSTEEGTATGEIFGTILEKSPSVVWYGKQRTTRIKTKSGK